MGTRAGFWIHLDGPDGWLGSIAWDGYPDGIPVQVMSGGGSEEWQRAVEDFVGSRNDGTTPDMGWPWPWNDSGLTDYAYVWTEDGVKVHGEGGWAPPLPDMSQVAKPTMGKRSGLTVFGR